MYKNFLIMYLIYKFSLCFVYCGTTALPPTTNGLLAVATTSQKTLYEREEKENNWQARGMPDDDDFELDYHHEEPKQEEPKATAEDPWQSYYDFIINEGSFKFWAVFQLVTAALLVYSAFAAVYYAKFNVITTDYDYYDDIYGRGRANTAGESKSVWSGFTSQAFQRIMDAVTSKKYS